MGPKLLVSIVLITILGCQSGKFQEKAVVSPEQKKIESPASAQSGEPNLFASQGDKLYLSWIEAVNDTTDKLCYAELNGQQWSEPVTIAEGSNWFVNWADFPSVAAVGDFMAAHWLVKSAKGTYDYDIQVAISENGGTSWNSPFVLHRDGIAAEHGFATLLPLSQDKIFAVWLDGRNTKSASDRHGHGGEGAMTLRATVFNQNGILGEEIALDERVCDCCQTDAALTDHGVVVVYRNRSEEEVRDIYIIRELADGWSEPQPIHLDNWKIAGCPVNGPAVAASGNALAVAWFNAAHENEPEVQIVFSEDAGATFGDPVRVDRGRPLGRVDVIMLDQQEALVSWLEATQKGAIIQAVRVNAAGDKSVPWVVASTLASRASGFPVMEKINDHVYFAWTQADSVACVQTAAFPVDRILSNAAL